MLPFLLLQNQAATHYAFGCTLLVLGIVPIIARLPQ
jgi:hypothetical protein